MSSSTSWAQSRYVRPGCAEDSPYPGRSTARTCAPASCACACVLPHAGSNRLHRPRIVSPAQHPDEQFPRPQIVARPLGPQVMVANITCAEWHKHHRRELRYRELRLPCMNTTGIDGRTSRSNYQDVLIMTSRTIGIQPYNENFNSTGKRYVFEKFSLKFLGWIFVVTFTHSELYLSLSNFRN